MYLTHDFRILIEAMDENVDSILTTGVYTFKYRQSSDPIGPIMNDCIQNGASSVVFNTCGHGSTSRGSYVYRIEKLRNVLNSRIISYIILDK